MQMGTHRPPEEHRVDPETALRPSVRGSGRLLWFVFIYVASLAVFAGLVYGLRGLIPR